MLSETEYAAAMANADPGRNIVRVVRTNFNYGKLTIYIEKYLTPRPDLIMLFVQAFILYTLYFVPPNLIILFVQAFILYILYFVLRT